LGIFLPLLTLGGIKLDRYSASNLSHDLTQQETDGMFLTFTNVSSPCQDVTFPMGQITDNVGNAFFIEEAISLPCSAPTATTKISSTQYSQTGSFPANALYSITERLSILPEDPGSVLNRLLQDTEQAAEGQFSSDSADQYFSTQFPAFQVQAQNMLCVHTDPVVAYGTLSIAEIVCATFLIDPYQFNYSVHLKEQSQYPGIHTCKLGTSTLDTHNSFITFDGMGNPVVSLVVLIKGTCIVASVK
jgi:hypothetical protein